MQARIDDELDATLLNEPHGIARMRAGQRGRHSVEALSDWQIFTPVGTAMNMVGTP